MWNLPPYYQTLFYIAKLLEIYCAFDLVSPFAWEVLSRSKLYILRLWISTTGCRTGEREREREREFNKNLKRNSLYKIFVNSYVNAKVVTFRDKSQIFSFGYDVRNDAICFPRCRYMHGVGSSERTFSTSCVSKYVFKASSMSLAVFQRRRHSSAYLIKVHWRRYAYNRINCFWCERAWALAVLSAWLKVSHPSFPLFAFSIASAALSHL